MWHFFTKKKQGQQLVLKISGMHCMSCALNIDGELEDTPGVFSSETSYARSTVKIHFDPLQISETTLRELIKKVGYEVE